MHLRSQKIAFVALSMVIGATALAAPTAHTAASPANDGGADCGMHGAMPDINAQIGSLKTRLGITEAQEKSWADYAKTLRDSAASRETAHKSLPSRPQDLSSDDRIKVMTQLIHAQELDRVALLQAAEKLMGSLSEYQKGKASEILPGLAPPDMPHGPGFGPPPFAPPPMPPAPRG